MSDRTERAGPVGRDVNRQCYELGATVAANLGPP